MQELEDSVQAASGGQVNGGKKGLTRRKVDTNMIVTSMAHKRCDLNLFVIFS